MNPFIRLPALPTGSRGKRGYRSAADAKASAENHGVHNYAILLARQEYAWLSPVEAFTVRAIPAVASGVQLVEFHR
jgi:hypothetical protein